MYVSLVTICGLWNFGGHFSAPKCKKARGKRAERKGTWLRLPSRQNLIRKKVLKILNIVSSQYGIHIHTVWLWVIHDPWWRCDDSYLYYMYLYVCMLVFPNGCSCDSSPSGTSESEDKGWNINTVYVHVMYVYVYTFRFNFGWLWCILNVGNRKKRRCISMVKLQSIIYNLTFLT